MLRSQGELSTNSRFDFQLFCPQFTRTLHPLNPLRVSRGNPLQTKILKMNDMKFVWGY
jgi:hypothetical protein